MFNWVLNTPPHYLGAFACFKNVLTSANGCLFGWAFIPMNTVYETKILN